MFLGTVTRTCHPRVLHHPHLGHPHMPQFLPSITPAFLPTPATNTDHHRPPLCPKSTSATQPPRHNHDDTTTAKSKGRSLIYFVNHNPSHGFV
ncbi:hypothetical protein Hdeb2414_s0065g00766481 [Helianthus debilis subsp. tardiflorus]